MRTPWTADEVALVGVTSWPLFHALFPERSYDSYEVKRRRVRRGTAGTHEAAPVKIVVQQCACQHG